ncbi:hypothetical protein CP967_06500 [Streptomyces nitrosporeus]|uniref:Tn3 transposase DDE domain-containing protein n=1 Tax=Streptomyces nitrosporeus TaxID=28894 RepID=A0A5J6F733_9ACTN|nr:hypothetical protein CP967_06500 [Streptomyces nitrosporeus]
MRALELAPELFGDVSEKLVAAWRVRASKEYPPDLRAAAGQVRYTLLAALCHVRQTEITDSLVELLHLLQSALVHVNTLLLQDILAEEKWQKKLTIADRRALSPLFRTHVNPYGRFEPDMNSRLDLGLSLRATVAGPRIPHDEAAATSA